MGQNDVTKPGAAERISVKVPAGTRLVSVETEGTRLVMSKAEASKVAHALLATTGRRPMGPIAVSFLIGVPMGSVWSVVESGTPWKLPIVCLISLVAGFLAMSYDRR